MKNFNAPEFTVDADMLKDMEGAYAHKFSHSGNNMVIDGGKNVKWSETVTGPTLIMEHSMDASKFVKTVEITTPKVNVDVSEVVVMEEISAPVFEVEEEIVTEEVEISDPVFEVEEEIVAEEVEISTPIGDIDVTVTEEEVEVTDEDDLE